MPRQVISICACTTLLLLMSCAPAAQDVTREGWTPYGASVTLDQPTAIGQILAAPDHFVGQKVAVEGTVTEVCTMMGCWIEVQGDDGSIRLKVNDGDMVFPTDAIGKQAVLEGKVEKLTYTKDEAIARARHEAEERGLEFDPSSVSPPYQEIRIWGSGALIQGES